MGDFNRDATGGGTGPGVQVLRRKRNFILSDADRDKFVARFGTVPASNATASAPSANMPNATTPVTPTTAAPVAPATIPTSQLRPQWNVGVTIKKSLKGDAKKKTCLIEVSGQEYVLKGAPMGNGAANDRANRSTAEDNAAAATFIRSLGLAGVRTPAIKLMDANERTQVIAALQAVVNAGGAEAKDASDLIASMQNGEVQLSEMETGGVDSSAIFIRKDIAEARVNVLKMRQDHQADPDEAWQYAMNEVAKRQQDNKKKTQYGAYANETDPAKRKQAVATVSQEVFSDVIQETIRFLKDIADGDMAAGLTKAAADHADMTANQAKIKAFAKSPAGMEAYAGVAVADLLTGMNDRILGAWNGGNFLFDPQTNELACVDNNKKTDMGLTEPDSATWNKFFVEIASGKREGDSTFGNKKASASIVDAIFDTIYTPSELDDNPDRPAEMPGFALSDQEAQDARDAIRRMLDKVIQAIDNDPAPDAAASKRAGFLKELMLLQNMATIPPGLVCTGAVDDPSTTDKLKRGLKGVVSGWFSGADKIKTNLRKNPLQADQALTDLRVLIAKHKTDSDGGKDRLAEHIRFLATACEFGRALEDKAVTLAALGKPPAFPTDAAAKELVGEVKDPVTGEADKWRKSLKPADAAIVALIDQGEADFIKAYTDRTNSY